MARSLDARCLLIVAVFAVASGFVDLRVRAYPERPYTEFIPAVAAGTAEAPERYRILVPFAFEWLARTTGAAPAAIWHATRLAWFLAAYVVFYGYLRTWFAPHGALLGVATVAATLPLTFTNSWAHPDHIPELALFTLGCWLLATQRIGWFAGVLALASLNRETAVFLVVLFALAFPATRQHVALTALFAVEWLAIYAGLRIWRGYEPYAIWQVARNLEFLKLLPPPRDPYYRAYAYFGVALVVPLWLVGTKNVSAQPFFVHRALLVVPVLAAVVFVISSIIEPRVLTPFYPLALPAVMFGLRVPIEGHDTL